MEQIALIKPTASFSAEIASYRREFLEDGSSMDGCGSLRRMENPADWLGQVEALARRETVPSNWVQSTQFLYVRMDDGRIVGMIQARHYFNDFLRTFGGNIGYSVRPSERRKGYATSMLHDCLPLCRAIGLERVLITCIDTNVGSRKTILANGGVYESTVFEPKERVNLERYWIDLSRR